LLEQLFAADLDRAKLCCAFDPTALEGFVDDLIAHLDAPELPQAPPVLPTCRKAADAVPCAEGAAHAALVWSRLRRVAVTMTGLEESDL
jgi:hypothetical protein